MATKVGELIWAVVADTKKFVSGLLKTEKQAKGLGQQFTSLGKLIKGGFVVAAVAGIGKVSKELISAASEAEETQNKFDVVFRDISGSAQDAAENLSDNFGLSSNAAKQLLSDTGDLLTGFGFTQDSALDLSEQVNQLAVDLASFTNFQGGAQGASEALTKALLGERESVKALGISILDADVKAKVLENTQNGLTFETERQAKAYATLQLAQEQSTNAIGDFERSSNSYANRLRVARAATEDLTAELGQFLLPAASEAVGVFGKLAGAVADYVKERNEARKLEGLIFEEQAGSVEELQKAYDAALAGYKENLEIIESFPDASAAALAIERSLVKEYGDALVSLSARLDAAKALETQQKKAARELREAEEAKRKADEEQRRRDLLALDAGERLSQIRFDALSPLEQDIKLLQEEIDQYSEIKDFPGVQELLTLLIEERNALQTEYNDSLKKTTGLTESQLEAEEELFREAVAGAQARADAEKAYQDEIERTSRKYEDAYNFIGGAISDLAFALAAGEDAWESFAKIGLGAIASLLDALGAQLAAQAAVIAATAFLGNVTAPVGAGNALVGSLAAYTAAGLVRGAASTFETGGVVPGVPGVPASGDNVMALLNPGEEVLRRDDPRHSYNTFEKGAVMVVDGKVLAEAVARRMNNGSVTIDGKRAIR